MAAYKLLIPEETTQKLESYQEALQSTETTCGHHLQQFLNERALSRLDAETLLDLLVNTKKPQIFAEMEVCGDGSDWNHAELSILGDISIAVPVKVYDDGRHVLPKIHPQPFSATLVYVPGALLRNASGGLPADFREVTDERKKLDFEAYYGLYQRRLLPVFRHIDAQAESDGKKALITLPGLGCGQFAGPFKGQLGERLNQVLQKFLQQHADELPHIKAVYYDPYQECNNKRAEVGSISLLVRPLTKGNKDRPQLCPPSNYAEADDDFADCELFSLVAWDHVSWPGNDFYIGNRTTDDGVKAAATNSMTVLTGVEGHYDAETFSFKPPADYANWEDVVFKQRLRLQTKGNVFK